MEDDDFMTPGRSQSQINSTPGSAKKTIVGFLYLYNSRFFARLHFRAKFFIRLHILFQRVWQHLQNQKVRGVSENSDREF
jgi:hypothetical protein